MRHKSILIRILGLIWGVLLLAACGAPPASPAAAPLSSPTIAPQPSPTIEAGTSMVIDTDMGADDIMAILYLLQKPDVHIKAITVSGTGLVHCQPGVRNALSLAELSGQGDIPVACGRVKPLKGDHHFPADWRIVADDMYGLKLPDGGLASNQTAAELLTSTIRSSPQKVVLLTLGPLTNVAEALQSDPNLVDKVKKITIMGGAMEVPGNIMGVPLSALNSTAEFNIFVDPYAASVVLQSGSEIALVPLDATNQLPIAPYFYKALKQNHATPAAEVVYELFQASPYLYQGGYYFWDPLAAVLSVDESLATFKRERARVVEAEGEDIGRTQKASDGTEIRVATAVDAKGFEQELLGTLNGGMEVLIDRTVQTPVPSMTVTFGAEDCTYDGPKTIEAGEIAVYWVAEDKSHQGYGLVIVTLDEGKTLADLDAWSSTVSPPWLDVVAYQEAYAGSRSTLIAEVEAGPIYFVCFNGLPEKKIGAIGPIQVGK